MTAPILPSGRRPNTPGGVEYDGASKDLALDAYGQIKSVHTIDEAMAMSLCFPKGSIKCTPEVGHGLASIKYLGGKQLGNQVQAAVLGAFPLSSLVRDGKVIIKSIEHQITDNGLVVLTKYINTQTRTARTLTSHGSDLEWYSNA